VQDVILDEAPHLLPLAAPGHGVQFLAQGRPAVVVKDGAVGRRGSVEGDLAPHGGDLWVALVLHEGSHDRH
jgi:hypothetical protein